MSSKRKMQDVSLLGLLFVLAGCGLAGAGPAARAASTPGSSSPPPAFPHIYLLNEAGMRAYRASDGAALWRFTLPLHAERATTMTVLGQTVFIGAQTAFFALDATSGRLGWTAEAGPQIQSMLAFGATLYVGSTTSVSAFAPDGRRLWTARITGSDTSRLVLDGDRLYVGGALASRLLALDAESGTLRWSVPLPRGEGASALVPQGGTLFVQTRHRLEARSAASGHLLWQTVTGVQAFQVADGVVSLIFRDPARDSGASALSGLRSLRASDGRRLWQEVTPVAVDGEADALTPAAIYRATSAGQAQLSAWSTRDGHVLWQRPTVPVSSLLERQGVLYGASGTLVSAFRAADGTPQWQQPLTATGDLSELRWVDQILYGVDTLSPTGLALALAPDGAVRWQIKTAEAIEQFLVA